MPRPARAPNLGTYSLYLTAEEAADGDLVARLLGCLSEHGEPSRSLLFRRLVEAERKKLERKGLD